MTPTRDDVTAANTLADVGIQSRHAPPLGGARLGAGRPCKPVQRSLETAQEVRRALERQHAYEAGTRDRLRLSRQATATADVCGHCGRTLAKEEPVWRAVVAHGLWGSCRRQTLRCLDCAPAEESRRLYGRGSAPCDTCRRVVWLGSGLRRWRRHMFCCRVCQARWYSRQRSLRAQPEREKACLLAASASSRAAETRAPAVIDAAKRPTASATRTAGSYDKRWDSDEDADASG